MAKLQIRTRVFQKLKKAIKDTARGIDKRTADKAGRTVTNQMNQLIGKGSSPIAGKGKFPAYRGQYRKSIQKGRFSGKRLRPVNLKLGGDFLKSLTHLIRKKTRGNWDVTITYNTALSKKKEDGHRKGTNRQGKRPTIPARNERFQRSIIKKVSDIYLARLNKVIKSKLK